MGNKKTEQKKRQRQKASNSDEDIQVPQKKSRNLLESITARTKRDHWVPGLPTP